MSTVEMTLTNSYWNMLRNLSDDVKLRLACLLTSSVAEHHNSIASGNESLTEMMVAKYAGALDDNRSADDIINDIRNARCSKTIQEFSL